MSDTALARRCSLVIRGIRRVLCRVLPAPLPLCLRLRGNEDAAEEIVQRVLIRGIDKLGTYRGEASLLTWLCALCRREIAAWRHKEGDTREVSLYDDRPDVRAA